LKVRDRVLDHRAFALCRILLIDQRFLDCTFFISVRFLFLNAHVVDMDVDAVPAAILILAMTG
jgi:hypothetical protein